MNKDRDLRLEAICTDLRRKYPMWSDKKIMAEARVIHSKRAGNA